MSADLEFPRDLTPQQRHAARLEARKCIEREARIPDRVSVVLPSYHIELRIARATCPVHPEMFTILHLDEQIEGNPCPLCWAAAGMEVRR